MIEFKYNDGGRANAGFKGTAGDCVCRSIAIATEKSYKDVYHELSAILKSSKWNISSPRDGVYRDVYQSYLESLGWKWISVMGFGTGCKVHLNAEELPKGRLVVRLSKHLTAVIDGVINDVYDPSRNGTRCVYGYFVKVEG